MKYARNILSTAIITTILFSTALYIACKKNLSNRARYINPCKDKVCPNHSHCDNGNCTCDDGYAGTDYDALTRTALLGTYHGFVVDRNPARRPGGW